ncbi:unnamed protein product [Parascedosporium putredinis]|uniref:Uncharacterized protein n=1 Tax=Parascedosporium putredinis TaxID=1442378 RepID=A0A9P1H9Y1_9PEZI|nr:unnamed protein product [Parascedosporium putredinis]CAI8001456.1 unnamed protein product [Parascedosporium putredinis]
MLYSALIQLGGSGAAWTTMNINDCAAAFEMQLSSIAMPETTTVRPSFRSPYRSPPPLACRRQRYSHLRIHGRLGGVVPDEGNQGADPSTGEDPEDTGATVGDGCSEDSALPLDDSTCSVTCEAGVLIPAPREVAVHVETTITTTITATIPGPSGGCSLTTTAIRTLILQAVETLTLECEPTTDDELRTGVPSGPEGEPSLTASDPGFTPEPPSETALTPEIPSSAQETADVPDIPATDPAPTTPTTVTRSQTIPSTAQTTPTETTTAVISAGVSIFHHSCRSYLLATLTMIAAMAWNSMA